MKNFAIWLSGCVLFVIFGYMVMDLVVDYLDMKAQTTYCEEFPADCKTKI